LNRIKASNEIRVIVNLKCQTSTVILPLDIKYSMRDLIFDIKYCSWAVFMRYVSYNANDVTAASCLFVLLNCK